MNKLLSPTESVQVIEQLKVVVREFSARAEEIEREFRGRSEAADRKLKASLADLEKRASGETEESKRAYAAEKERLQLVYEARTALLAQARKTSSRKRLDFIESIEGRRKYAVQKGTLDAQKRRETLLAEADALLAETEGALAAHDQNINALHADARSAFRGYGSFARSLDDESLGKSDFPEDERALLGRLDETTRQAGEAIARFRKALLPALFRLVQVWIWLAAVIILVVLFSPTGQRFGVTGFTYNQALVIGAGAGAVILGLFYLGKAKARGLAREIATALATARNLHKAASAKAAARHAADTARIEQETRDRISSLNSDWDRAIEEGDAERERLPEVIEKKYQRAAARNDEIFRRRMKRLDENYSAVTQGSGLDKEERAGELKREHQAFITRLSSERQAAASKMEEEWQQRTTPLLDAIRASNESAAKIFPPWTRELVENWNPPPKFEESALFGKVRFEWQALLEPGQKLPQLPLPDAAVSLPLALKFPAEGSVLFETSGRGETAVIHALNNIVFRLLSNSPAGRLSFTIVDPVKLGQNFSAITHLADYEDNLINGKIWTQPEQIDVRLGELTEHMEKVIQMYLRNEYETIAEYNQQAGNIAEKYHFVVVADFPTNWNESALRRLLRIAASGARCGVFTLIQWDRRHSEPHALLLDELRKNSVCVQELGEHFVLSRPPANPGKLQLEPPPSAEIATPFLQRIGELSRGANRVIVPFEQVAPDPNEIWSLDTSEEVRVPIGRSGATKLQYFAIGRGTKQHVLVAGKTGSGKSTLFHAIITSLGLWASPDEVEFYLIDFKKGVEFKAYGTWRLPHARVVAIESDREFALSVLQRVDDELRRRGDLFRAAGVQDLAGYRRSAPDRKMPRTILLIDEFQEFFVEEDRVSQGASMLLDRIVRQGRAFGIHVILGSQTLGGAYTLARTTIGQMVVRIALQTNEADAYLIMDESNAAPRLLSRPGEGIYNDMAGASEGNSPFQAVWIDERERDDRLQQIREIAKSRGIEGEAPIVFEGNAPADIRENAALDSAVATVKTAAPASARVWLGAPNSIKGPTEVSFTSRSGNNLLIVGQREESILGMIGVCLVSLASQFPAGAARFFLLDSNPPESREKRFLEKVLSCIPHEKHWNKDKPLPDMMSELASILDGEPSDSAPPTFLLVHGLHNFKKLRPEDEFAFSLSDEGKAPNPAAQFTRIFTEGPSRGLHVIATIDTYNNVNRHLGRKGLTEFDRRVLFQMSASDSASLTDDPRASTLGYHRALLYNEQEGSIEIFRPYAWPDEAWLENICARLTPDQRQ